MQNYSQDSTSPKDSSFSKSNFEFLFLLALAIIIGFGNWVTVPSVKDKKRKMRKYGRRIYAGIGLLISLLITWFLANIILAVAISYLSLLVGILMALHGK